MAASVTYYAYVHSKPNGVPFYVGKGKLRRAKYLGERNDWHGNTVAKYGRQNIHIELFECRTEEQAFRMEVALIRFFKSRGIPLCNFTAGGEGGSNPCEETRVKLRAAAKRKGISAAMRAACILAKTGVPLTEEQKRKQSASMRAFWTGMVLTSEHRANLSAASKRRGISDAMRAAGRLARVGSKHPHSEETKAKIGAANKGKVRSAETIEAMSRRALGSKHPHTDEAKAKMREACKGRIPPSWVGRKHSPETKALLSSIKIGQPNHCLGKKRSAETIEKMRASMLAKPTRYWLGKKRSPETIAKIRATKLAQSSALAVAA